MKFEPFTITLHNDGKNIEQAHVHPEFTMLTISVGGKKEPSQVVDTEYLLIIANAINSTITDNAEITGGCSIPSGLIDGLCPQKMAWEQNYGIDSRDVKYAVRYDAIETHYDGCAKIQIAAEEGSAYLPITQLDWLIACLCKIREAIPNVELRGCRAFRQSART